MAIKNQKQTLRYPKIYNPPKEKKTKKFSKIIILFCLLIIIIVAIIYCLFLSSIFTISSIEIKGNLPEEGQNYINQFKGANLFAVKSNDIATKLSLNYPQFLSIDVYKGIPNVLRVEITERQAELIWQTNNQDYLVDSDGLAYKDISADATGNLPIVIDNKNLAIEIPAQVASTNFVNFITELKIKCHDAGQDIKDFEINDTIFQTDAVTNSGIKIIFDTTRSINDQIDAFNQVYSAHKDEIKQYVDTRVESKVYYQ